MKTPHWYSINATAQAAEISIYDSIGGHGITPTAFIADLKKHEGKKVTLRIHSPGGSVLDGAAIVSALQRHRGGVETHIDGLAASMASVVALVGVPVRMAANGFFMIHNAAAAAIGDSRAMRKTADLVDKIQNSIVSAYTAKTKKAEAQIRKWMDDETWFTAAEAKENGFIDEITGPVEIANSFDLTNFKAAPPALEKRSAADHLAIFSSKSGVEASAYFKKFQTEIRMAAMQASIDAAAKPGALRSRVVSFKKPNQ